MEFDHIVGHLCLGPLLLSIGLIYLNYPPKKINLFYGHRTKMSMKNNDTWNEANKRSGYFIVMISSVTCFIQIFGVILNFNFDKTFLSATIFLVVGAIASLLIVEKQLKSIFDKDGNRKN